MTGVLGDHGDAGKVIMPSGSSTSESIFSVELKAPDKIFGLNKRFEADPDSSKLNLGIGVFRDSSGKKIPHLKTTLRAEEKVRAGNPDPGYLPILGHAGFRKHVEALVLAGAKQAIDDKRTLTAQTIGGTNALRLGADMLRTCLVSRTRTPTIWISDPTWENHSNIFSRAGFKVENYHYYNRESGKIDFEGMKLALTSKSTSGNVVLMHACCHNPTGVDIPADGWADLVDIFKDRNLIPFFDFAYQGFGRGIVEDRAGIDAFVNADMPVVIAYSCSKNFSFYNERLGACIFVTDSQKTIPAFQSQLEPMIRADISNCPAHGARIFAEILGDPTLRAEWEAELNGMRDRITKMRGGLIDGLCSKGLPWSHIRENHGMFSFLPLNSAQTELLITKHHIYGLDSGGACRVNVAALTDETLSRVIAAIADVA